MRDLVRGMAVALIMAATSSCGGAGAPVSQAPARAPSTIEPATESPSPPADPERTRATDAVFAEFDGATPGCAVGVHLDGSTAMTGAYGSADLGSGTPLTPETVFDIASVSKQITAGMVMGLVLEGGLSLEDDVTSWLPDLDVTPGSVSVADLVHHTSGLPDYLDLLDVDVETVTSNADTMAALEGIDAHRPGTRFQYSNTNYFLLGQIIEAVTGQGLPDYAEDVVFAPLGMETRGFETTRAPSPPTRRSAGTTRELAPTRSRGAHGVRPVTEPYTPTSATSCGGLDFSRTTLARAESARRRGST